MSTADLPLVSSGRSSISSATSSRGYMHSAGSAFQKNDPTFRRQVGEEDFQESCNQGLWDAVEEFLSKPSPSLSNISGKSIKVADSKPPVTMLPMLTRSRRSPDNQATRPSRPACATIDPKLLQDAFAYANRLQHIDIDDNNDEEKQHQSWKSSKAFIMPSGHAPFGGPHESRCSGRKKKSVYTFAAKPKGTSRKRRNLRGESPSTDLHSKFNGHMDPQTLQALVSTDLHSKFNGHMDPQTLQALVSNFQNGTTINELRRELTASQQSLTESRHVLQEAAQNFYHGTE